MIRATRVYLLRPCSACWQWRFAGTMNFGLGHDEVKPPVEPRLGDSIEQLE